MSHLSGFPENLLDPYCFFACTAGQYSTVGARTFDIRTTQLSEQLQGLQAEVANLRNQLNEQAQGTKCCWPRELTLDHA
jgi:hypothetical protein